MPGLDADNSEKKSSSYSELTASQHVSLPRGYRGPSKAFLRKPLQHKK